MHLKTPALVFALLVTANFAWGGFWDSAWADDDDDDDSHHHLRDGHRQHDHRQHGQDRHGINDLKLPGGQLPNLHEVHPWLFRGGAPQGTGIKKLSEMGVSTVVDLRDRVDLKQEAALCKQYGLKHVSIPMSHLKSPSKAQINEFLKIVGNAKKHTGTGSVYVHCQSGEDRTGCMVAISRLAFDNYTFQEAYDEMLHLGFHRHFDSLTLTVQQFAEEEARKKEKELITKEAMTQESKDKSKESQ